MPNKIQVRRGLKAELPVLAVGELGFCTDAGELFIGTNDGNMLINVTLADIGAEPAALRFFDTPVPVAAWTADAAYADYGYRAAVPLVGVTSSMLPDVVFDLPDAAGGNLGPVTAAYDGGIYLYAKAAPDADITIPTIVVWR